MERFIVLLFSVIPVLTYANSNTDIIIANNTRVAKEGSIVVKAKTQADNKLLPAYNVTEDSATAQKKEPLAFSSDPVKKIERNSENINTSVLPDLFHSKLPQTFYVQGRLIEKENMSREGSDVDGAALNFVFVR